MKKIDFNQDWIYYKEGHEDMYQNINLPHDAMIHEKRAVNVAVGGAGGYFDSGKYYYKKTFHVSDDWKEKKVILECEGIYQDSEVFLNGEKIGGHYYGYTNFYTDCTPFLKCDEDNELVISADNRLCPNSRWYTGTGIYRPVWLYIGEKSCILPDGIQIRTENEQQISVSVDVLNYDSDTQMIKIEILSQDGIVAESMGEMCR